MKGIMKLDDDMLDKVSGGGAVPAANKQTAFGATVLEMHELNTNEVQRVFQGLCPKCGSKLTTTDNIIFKCTTCPTQVKVV